ncbi:hypothetical protein DH2020_023130 [Rehmannia glutinosa]|uniref:Uncharacterized protein n=1 Tax=Rehmannia glutinosa TaxID=99300 RepID=A0ABR0W952_REHGL
MDRRDDELQLAIYRPPSFTGGCLEIRLFYVRITPCAVDNLPDQLKLRHLRREVGVLLEINGTRIPSSDAVSINLRRDRVDKDSSEVTYVSTDSVKISGPAEFERADPAAAWSNENALDNDSKTGWSLECYVATSIANGRSALVQPKKGVCSPSIEVYIAGCCSGTPVILMKTVLISPRKKVRQGMMLDAIPEDEEMGKEQRNLCNGLVRQRKLQPEALLARGSQKNASGTPRRCMFRRRTPRESTVREQPFCVMMIEPRLGGKFMAADMDDYESDGKVAYSNYSEEMYPGEDGQLSCTLPLGLLIEKNHNTTEEVRSTEYTHKDAVLMNVASWMLGSCVDGLYLRASVFRRYSL